MAADVPKHAVLQCEPLLVRLRVSNPKGTVAQVVPPYIATHTRARPLALRLLARGQAGEWAEPPLRFTQAYWLTRWASPDAFAMASRPWTLEAGAAATVWYSLNMLYSLHEPGRYHLRFVYAPTREMVAAEQWPVGAPEGGLWLGTLEVDLGAVEIAAPPDEERPAAEFLAANARACAPDPSAEPYAVHDVVAARWPTSVYLPYTEFYAMRTEAQSGLHEGWHKPSGLEALRSEVSAFRGAHPDFPLNHELDTIVARYAYGVAVRTAYPLDAHERVPKRAEVLAVLEAGRGLLETARASGDYGLAADMAATVGRTEWAYRKHIDAALAGRDPE